MAPDGGSIGCERAQCVMVTGGTGSFGAAFTRFLLSLDDAPRIRIYSRDEHKQEDLARELNDSRVTFILGDIRDGQHLRRAMDGCDAVVHAAALKVVAQGEQHVNEFIGVNVLGSQSVAQAAVDAGVKRSILISSDKAVQPINLYGVTKAAAERVFIHANRVSVSRGLKFSVVRGGNVWGSRGSVVEVWRAAREAGLPIDVYNPSTTRFHLPMDKWTAFVWRALNEQHGGEVFIPKCRAWQLHELAKAMNCSSSTHLDNRDGDKMHEMLIAPAEMCRSVDLGWAYAVEPTPELRKVWNYAPYCAPVMQGGWYSSDSAPRITVSELKEMIA